MTSLKASYYYLFNFILLYSKAIFYCKLCLVFNSHISNKTLQYYNNNKYNNIVKCPIKIEFLNPGLSLAMPGYLTTVKISSTYLLHIFICFGFKICILLQVYFYLLYQKFVFLTPCQRLVSHHSSCVGMVYIDFILFWCKRDLNIKHES